MSTEPTGSNFDGGGISIDQQIIEEGTSQLSSEIEVLEAWLVELEEAAYFRHCIYAGRRVLISSRLFA